MTTLLRLDAITIGDRFRKDLGDMDALVASIETVGLLHPIVVMADADSNVTLVAGERRLRACERLGWERIPVRMLPAGVNLLRAEHDENTVREPFTPSEAVAIAAALRPVAEAEARERQGARTDVTGEPPANVARSRDVVAAAVGMGRTTLRKAEAVVEAVAADPSLTPIQEAMDESGNVSGAHAAIEDLPPDPAPEQVEAAAHRVRQRKADTAPYAARERALTPQMREAEQTAAASAEWHRAWSAVLRITAGLDPETVLPRMTADEHITVRAAVRSMRDWLDRVEQAMAHDGLRAIQGGRS